MVIKIWSIRNPLLSGVLLLSILSQAAGAAELPASQPVPTPGIPTPDQAVRQMASRVVLDSRAAAALSSNAKLAGAIRPISPVSTASSLPSPSQVLSNCPTNVCGLIATQPPVVLGTASPLGINQTEQNKFAAPNSASIPLKADTIAPPAITPNDQVTGAAKVSLSIEPGLSKDIAFGQPAAKSAKDEKKVSETQEQITTTPTIANITTPEKAIGIGNVQDQITSFTSQLVANSWKLITVLPKPQLDSSLLNIGSSSSFRQYDSLSFSPRLTLGTPVKRLAIKKLSSSLSNSPLFTTQKPVIKPLPLATKWDQSSLLVQSLSISSFRPDKFTTQRSFASFNQLEASSNPFSVMTFLAMANYPQY